jgi:tRNA(adenine34) deaminase
MGMNESDSLWMAQAYELALKAKQQGEVPVGAVLVSSDQQLLGRGWNQVIGRQDPSAHAELLAIREAAQALGNHRLLNTTLYVTLEPCAMCAGALVHARIARVVFATRDFKTGAAGSVYNLLSGYPLNHQVKIDEGILQHDCAQLLSGFFRKR